MNVLIIDCSAGMGVYLCKGSEVFSHVDENQKKHTDELLVSVDELLKDANISVKDIDVIGVCKGPGSFTGIRVAISICKGFAVESSVKVVEISNFDAFEFGVVGDKVFVLEGFSEFVYVRKNINGVVQDSCENISDFAKEYFEKYNHIDIYVSTQKMQNILEKYEINAKIMQNKVIDCVKNKIDKKEFAQINMIEPVYLRASQAEIERNKKLAK